uniref:Putative reverse transcriptase maturase n=1 Tax=Monomorphina aenigmatica TaxID=304863 RepID=L0BID5_MONAE|nr:putative reverse transcriptase maturase [Monomorphina aenigmatica]AFZ88771.1 putative reverse transcriptase maturase [Monomorphina aenigmatica]
MKASELVLRKVLTPEFLEYSFTDLKYNKFIYFGPSSKAIFEPISKKWFSRVSYLLRTSEFVYQDFNFTRINKFFSKRLLISNLKFKIIENAFLKLLQPFFSLNNADFDLNECLRKF